MPVSIAAIRRDGGTQPRAFIDWNTVDEYVSALDDGAQFPPVVVYYDGTDYWLADGFHRVEAHAKAGRDDIEADVRQGTRRDAVLFSAGANATHGMRRTNADKRRAVMTLLNDDEWQQWSDSEIARRAGVSQPFVSKLRGTVELSYNDYTMDRKVTRNGTTYTMTTVPKSVTQEIVDVVYREAPSQVKEAVADGVMSIPQAEQLTRALRGKPEAVVALALRVAGDSVDKVDILHSLYKSNGKDGSNDTFAEIEANGGFHYGDDMEQWCDFENTSVLEIKKALQALADYHKIVEQQAKEAARAAKRESELAALDSLPLGINFVYGDCAVMVESLPQKSVKLLLTDPPYGMAFQSNRRTATPQLPRIENDDDIDTALGAVDAVLRAVDPAMSDECHVLMFCNWRHESRFIELLRFHGYDVAASIVWVKENHTSGDLSGFAPKHERIIHARRNRAPISPRIPDVLEVPRQYDTGHPAEKPVRLLEQLIKVSTIEGELVVDPFAGTGSTALAAMNLNRKAYCIEVNEEWYKIGKARIGGYSSN